MGCLFCDIVEKKVPATIVYESDHVVAFRDIRAVAPTHVLVVPRKHVASIHDLADADGAMIGNVMLGAKAVADALGLTPDGFRLVINDGENAGQTVHHIHVHVLGGRAFSWPPG